MNLDLHKERTRLLKELGALDTEAQHDRIFTAVTETGGCWIGPNSTGRTMATHLVEIDLLGCLATGTTDEEAIRSWMGIVRRQIEELEAA